MIPAFQIIQIIISVILIAVILLQVRMQGLGGVFGQGSSIARARRGFEKPLFQFTIVLSILFVGISIISVIVQR